MRVKLIGTILHAAFDRLATPDHRVCRQGPVPAVKQALLDPIMHVVEVDEADVRRLAERRRANTARVRTFNRNAAIGVLTDEEVDFIGMAGEVAARTYAGVPLDEVQAGPDDGRDYTDPEDGLGVQVKSTRHVEGVLYFLPGGFTTDKALLAVVL